MPVLAIRQGTVRGRVAPRVARARSCRGRLSPIRLRSAGACRPRRSSPRRCTTRRRSPGSWRRSGCRSRRSGCRNNCTTARRRPPPPRTRRIGRWSLRICRYGRRPGRRCAGAARLSSRNSRRCGPGRSPSGTRRRGRPPFRRCRRNGRPAGGKAPDPPAGFPGPLPGGRALPPRPGSGG